MAAQGLMATVVRKGDEEAGALILKINRFASGCDVYVGATAEDGSPGWMLAAGGAGTAESDADAYIARQVTYDADLWVIEIEDPKGQFQMSEKIINSRN